MLGMGSAALALPLLNVLRSDAQAQEGGKHAKFAIFIYQPNGVYQNHYWPTGSETDFVLSDILSPLQPFKDKLLLLGPQLDADNRPLVDTGLTYNTKPPQHRAPVCLTANIRNIDLSLTKDKDQDENTVNNYSDGTYSVDQLIGERMQGESPFLSLNFGVHPFGGDTVSDINFLNGIAQRRMWQADEAWDRIFGSVVDLTDAGAVGNAEAALRKHTALSDFLHGRFAGLRKQLGQEDRDALDAHLSALRSMEDRKARALGGVISGGSPCATPARRDVPTDATSQRTGSDTEQLLPFFFDLMVGAFRCGLSKVASVTLSYPGGGGEGGVRMPWLDFTNANHGVSHHNEQPAHVERYSAHTKWWVSQVAYLMEQLASVPFEGGTLLDQTMIYYFNRHGEGNSHANHALPNLILGGSGGHFRMGRFLKLPRTSPTRVLISLAHCMGLTDVEEFGNDALQDSGPLSGLT